MFAERKPVGCFLMMLLGGPTMVVQRAGIDFICPRRGEGEVRCLTSGASEVEKAQA
jgi:hypothetical protein